MKRIRILTLAISLLGGFLITFASTVNAQTLIEIATKKFKHLNPAETLLLESVQNDHVAVFKHGDQPIRAELLVWLCTDPDVARKLPAKGVNISGATIAGDLDFTAATLLHPLVIRKSTLGKLLLSNAETRSLDFSGNFINSISAGGVFVKGNMVLSGDTVEGGVWFFGADIGGQLDCTGATFENPKSKAYSECEVSYAAILPGGIPDGKGFRQQI